MMIQRTSTARLAFLAVLIVSAASACTPQRSPGQPTVPGPTPAQPTVPGADTASTPFPAYEAEPLPTDQNALFAGSGACATCHTDMSDEAGVAVSIDTNWRGAMMANASRDPYWQASVRSEVIDHPALKGVIEDKCATCHTPMARFTAVVSKTEATLLDGGFLDPEHPRHRFAIDGVSCTLCHQIEEEGLDEPESFSGGFSIDTERAVGERLAYGPFPTVEGPAEAMRNASGYRPIEGPQTLRSELCASCHTLYTPYVDENGEIAGTFPEQVPYLEWQHSDYRNAQACQSCHMPPAEGGVHLATVGGGPPRKPFAQHLFIGGNAYVLKMLWYLGDELDATGSAEDFSQKIEQTLAQLETRSASVAIGEVIRSDTSISFAVTVQNQAGHKMPTGFPSRRVWLHVVVTDGEGNVIFESGGSNSNGAIDGNDYDADRTAYEPHYGEINDPDQVQVYEAILKDVSGEITTGLLQAQGYQKDNRLLPSGFDKASAGEEIAVRGGAAGDDDFTGGSDTVRYAIDLPAGAADLTVTVELLYQSISYRWAENLRGYDDAEVTRFVGAYTALPNRPVTVDAVTLDIEP